MLPPAEDDDVLDGDVPVHTSPHLSTRLDLCTRCRRDLRAVSGFYLREGRYDRQGDRAGGTAALVSYRNRVQEIHVPEIEALPTWQLDEQWAPPGTTAETTGAM